MLTDSVLFATKVIARRKMWAGAVRKLGLFSSSF